MDPPSETPAEAISPEVFVETLSSALGANLRAAILYGPAVLEAEPAADVNHQLLIVTSELGISTLRSLAEPVQEWVRAGNSPPFLINEDRLRRSGDVFGIQLLDIKENHRLLAGTDILPALAVSRHSIRQQLEHELKRRLMELREAYLLTRGRPRDICTLLVRTAPHVHFLQRATLRLYQVNVPARPSEVAAALTRHVRYDTEVLATIDDIRRHTVRPRDIDAEALFEAFLDNLGHLGDAVDRLRAREAME